MTRTVGILALQGNVREHEAVLTALGSHVVRVRRPTELDEIDGLVIPGGESSTIDKLSRTFGVREPLIEKIRAGFPVFGTCAGLILLADRIVDGIDGQQTFGGLDVTVRRNAFGRQADSFETELEVSELGDPPVRAAFIRAPVIEEIGSAARALATLPGGRIVAAEQGNLLGASFHPEQTGETRLHERFLALMS
ncbi:MAG TPA: pyridoxal 5'-phosphate synthase glutaminase subunit PdxT [Microbacterium sp.]|nr:pyridoxal 5'-phosphate synthase glutaminase subunit PdxT [Microbacterium sp.]